MSPAVMEVLTSVKSLSVVKETGGPSPRRAVEITVLGANKLAQAANRLEEVVTNAKALLAEEDERVGQLLKAKGLDEVKAIMSGHQYVKG